MGTSIYFAIDCKKRGKSTLSNPRSVPLRSEAEVWANAVEAEMNQGTFVDRSKHEQTIFGELPERYVREEAPKKRGWETERPPRFTGESDFRLCVPLFCVLHPADIALSPQ
ncbi:hypothetical protein [Ralstonia sp. SET104]|uniref:hypothetical protein n=1 Tax=Ralstonia sp. SET104 TaxID=2448774 RepID=UPI000F55ABF4|nr:hypothetical protein [Ralstonia sp. SET104]GCB06638.1 hypothetical protein PSUB009319_42690 [Ralstonia sp. SET104]